MPTMLDVAKRARVSLSTVSYAINGARPISEATRQRIFAAMDELGYHPHALARGLASKRSRIIALLFPTHERGLGLTELEFVTSATETAMENGYNLVLWSSEAEDPHELRQRLQQGLVDGVMLMEVHLGDPRLALLRSINMPFSMIGRAADDEPAGYADVDFDRTTRDAVIYLASLGHRQIAFLNQSWDEFQSGYGPVVRAHAGFERAIKAAGLTGVAQFCRPTPLDGRAALETLLGEHPQLTALVAMNDRAIPGAMQAILDRGWSIPDDFSIMSILSSPRMTEMTNPPLTTLAVPSAELGRLGIEQLIQQLDAQEPNQIQELLTCQLVVRGSTGLAPRGRG